MIALTAPLMLASALVAAPAAKVVHQTSVVHEGHIVSVSYEPRFRTSHKQTGIGPRASVGCLWTTSVSVERSVTDASGHSIAALTRVIGDEKAGSGMHVGHCRHIEPKRMAGFARDAEKLRSYVVATADRDAPGLRTELASLDRLHVANAR